MAAAFAIQSALVAAMAVFTLAHVKQTDGSATVIVTVGAAVIVTMGWACLLLRHHLRRSVETLMHAEEEVAADNLTFRLEWDGPTEFLPVVSRFNAMQEHIQATIATKARLEDRESAARAANAALNTEIAASAETLRAVSKAARAWRQTFDSVDFVLLTVDQRYAVQRVNRAALTLLGGRFDDWLGRSLDEFPAKQPWTAIGAIVRDVFAAGTALTAQIEAERVWELACTGLSEEDGFSVVWARDITPTVELQRAVLRSEAMGAMGELLAGVAHEVRNPLFGITALLDAWSLQPEIQQGPFLPMLRKEVTRMRQLMEELLEYGRPFNSSLVVGDLNAVAAEAVSILSHASQARGVTIHANVSGLVNMDKARMLRVFLNLIQNAIDHSPAGGAIHVDSWTRPDVEPAMIQIAVRDFGPGFTDADLPRVFNPFFTRRQGGTGLGLPIVQRILDEHGGTVVAANHPDGGALIRVQLPRAVGVTPA
jgi:signal transduction histidine kinase